MPRRGNLRRRRAKKKIIVIPSPSGRGNLRRRRATSGYNNTSDAKRCDEILTSIVLQSPQDDEYVLRAQDDSIVLRAQDDSIVLRAQDDVLYSTGSG